MTTEIFDYKQKTEDKSRKTYDYTIFYNFLRTSFKFHYYHKEKAFCFCNLFVSLYSFPAKKHETLSFTFFQCFHVTCSMWVYR